MPHDAPLPAAKPVAAAWRRDTGGWVLDGTVVHLRQPPMRHLVPLILSWSPVPFILVTCRDNEVAAWIAGRIVDRRDPLDAYILDPVVDEIIDTWFGMPRWTVQRLWKEAIGAWRDIDGEAGAKGVDVLALPPDRATNTIYRMLRARYRDAKDLQRWARKLEEPPVRVLHAATSSADTAADWAAVAALAGMPAAAMPTPTQPVDSQITHT